MAFDHGSRAQFLITTGGVERDLSAYLSEAGLDRESDLPDVTALGDEAHSYIGGLPDGSAECEGFYDPVAWGWLDTIANTITTFRYRPQGTAIGKPEITGRCLVSGLHLTTSVDGAAAMTFDLTVHGKPQAGVQTAASAVTTETGDSLTTEASELLVLEAA